jgi:hypothetical protein
MFFKRILVICFLVLFFRFVFPASAYAYLDPGSGSFILQIIIASIMGLIFMVKLYWKKIRAFFDNIFSRNVDESDGET